MKISAFFFVHATSAMLGAYFVSAPLALAEQETIFFEDFEACEPGAHIGTTANAEWRPNGFQRGQTPGSAVASPGQKENPSLIAITTPETNDGNATTSYNLTAWFAETSGALRFTFDVFPEQGSGQIVIRPRSDRPSDSLVHIQFRGGRDMVVQAFGSDGAGGKTAISIGKFRLNRWYKVIVTLNLNKTAPTYDVEIADVAEPSNTIGLSQVESPTAASAAGNFLIGSIFSEKSRYGWDNIKVERIQIDAP